MSNLNDITLHCRSLLNECPEASPHLDYINTRLNAESQDKFQFGYFPNSSNLELLFSIFSKESLKHLNLIYPKEIMDSICPRNIWVSYFEHHPLIMPYRDLYGNIIALVGRTLLNDEDRKVLNISKYKNTVFKKGNHLFGLYEAKDSIMESDSVYVVEGQFDVIKAFERGLTNIVALGNSNMTAYQLSLLVRYTKNINLLLDNDEAGFKGRKKIIDKFSNFANIQNFYVQEPYKDVDEYFTVHSDISFIMI